MKKGIFITLEGVDGAGKSSHTEWLCEYFLTLGREVVVTREPGGTPIGEQLREILLHQEMSQATEVLLMFAARQESIEQIIKPALAQGKVVISDRFTDSTYAYQGGGRGFNKNKIDQLAQWVHADVQRDLTLLFDVPVEVARARLEATRQLDRFEREHEDFFLAVQAAYHECVSRDPQCYYVVDSTQSMVSIREQLSDVLKQRFPV
ncbi:MAG: dTMP kinase [Pelistega sp.]|nr:dTMP kinase [Pelistega sp.]